MSEEQLLIIPLMKTSIQLYLIYVITPGMTYWMVFNLN